MTSAAEPANGTTLAGMVVNPILPSLRDRELAFILTDANSRAIFIPQSFGGHDYAAMLARVASGLPAGLSGPVARAADAPAGVLDLGALDPVTWHPLGGAVLGRRELVERIRADAMVDAGGVSLQYNGLVTAAFPSLDSTSESFVLYMNDVLESVSAGGLTVVVVVSLAGCPMLPYVEFPLLEEVTGDVHVTDDFGAYVAFPALTTIGGSLHLEDEQAPGIATSASLPALEILGGLEVADTSSLPEVNLMALSAVDGDVFCSGADGLDAIVLPSLAEVGGNVTLEDLPDLQLLAMDSLVWVSGWIELEGNPSLVSASWPALQSVGGGLFVHRSTTRSTRSLARRWPRSWDPCRYSRRRRSRPSISPRCRRSAVTCGSSTRRASPTSCRSTVWRRSART